MRALSIRNLPDDVYARLQALAAANHRSMQEQARRIIEQEVNLAMRPGLSVAREWRQRLANRTLGNTVDDVRQDRAR